MFLKNKKLRAIYKISTDKYLCDEHEYLFYVWM